MRPRALRGQRTDHWLVVDLDAGTTKSVQRLAASTNRSRSEDSKSATRSTFGSLGQLRQHGAVGLDLANRVDDLVEFAAFRQQHVLKQTNRRRANLSVALQLVKAFAIGLELRRIE